MPYAYKTLHYQGLPHAFPNTLLFLDYDRKGFPYPVLPFHVNCYGSSVVKNRGGSPLQAAGDAEPDPPAPSARLCFDIGAATARVFKESRYRAVQLGSSSWSHAFLVEKHHMLWPDIEADRAFQMRGGPHENRCLHGFGLALGDVARGHLVDSHLKRA
jgi:hypothetical protein